MKRLLTLVLSALLVAILAACAGPAAPPANQPAAETPAETEQARPFRIGYVSANFQTPFQVAIMDWAEARALELGMEFDKQDGQDDPLTQISIIQTYITQGKDLILLVPTQPDALIPAIAEAYAAGIPVITVNRSAGEGAQVVTEISIDLVEGGRMAGHLASRMLGGEGRVAMLLGILGSSPQVLESQGFAEYIAANAPGIEVIAEQTTNWDRAQAVAATENLLTRFGPGEIDGIVTQGPDCAAAAIQVIRAMGRYELLGKVVGFDFPYESLELIRDGSLFGTIHQDPYVQGRLAAEIAFEFLNDPTLTFPRDTFHELFMITAENAEEFRDRTAW